MGGRAPLADSGVMKSLRNTLPAALVTCAAALTVPSLASAADFCVDSPAGCNGTPVTKAGFSAALTAAQSNGSDDRFFLAPGTYTNAPLAYQSLEKVELIGTDRASTVLESTVAGTVLTLGGNQDSEVSNVTVVPAGKAQVGLNLASTKADRVDVKADPAAQDVTLGLTLSGGADFSNGTVSHDLSQWGAELHGSGGTIEDSVIDVPEGIGVVGGASDGKVLRSTVKAPFGVVVGTGHLQLADTVVDTRVTKTPQVGLFASTSAGLGGTAAAADLERVTIIGKNQSPNDAAAIAAEANGAGKTGSVSARDSIFTGFQNAILRQGNNNGHANVSTDRSLYLSAGGPGLDNGDGTLTETNRLSVNPHFVDAAGGDFHLAADSPLIDAGTPGDLPAGALDRDGKPRASDGNGDCSHVSDIGAFEFQGTSVKAAAKASAPSAVAGQPVEFSSEGSCIPGPGSPVVKWSFDDGASADGATASHAFAAAGKHTAVATVTDADGHSATATAEVEVTPAPVAPKAAAPAISALRVKGKTVRFKLSRAAEVDIRFAKTGKHGKFKRIKTRLRVSGKKGANRAGLPRSLRHLKPGTYRLSAVATSADGARSKARSVRFKVAEARRR